ncbi:MAG: LptF/LptG family permease, partial [Bacteroidales bacterium]|nr:LptF/LptG family permease [Bacteroidales bacterium]
MDLAPKKIDWYIFKRFMGTFVVALLLIIGIVIIFDISEKIDDFVSKKAPLHAIVFDYYLNFIPYFINMFSPLFVFITVIFFTSRMAANSEIIAILSCGISFHRMMRPYIAGAFLIAAL